MFPDFSKFMPMLQIGFEDMKNLLGHIYAEIKAGREAAQRQARALDFEFGVVESTDSAAISPRRLSNLPVVIEETIQTRKEVDVQAANQGRAPYRGFYANLGENPFKVVLIGVDGRVTAPHTMPGGTTISLSCLVTKVIIDPIDNQPAFYQLYMH